MGSQVVGSPQQQGAGRRFQSDRAWISSLHRSDGNRNGEIGVRDELVSAGRTTRTRLLPA
jgi:hypothetical protein